MKEIKYYISDDKTQQSSDPEKIREYEAKMDAVTRAKVGEFNDEYGTLSSILKLEKPTDLNYLRNYHRIRFGNIEDGYIGYAVMKYTGFEVCATEILPVEQYLSDLQTQIHVRQLVIDQVTKLCNKR